MTETPAPLPELRLQVTNRSVEHFMVRDSRGDLFDLDAPYQRGSVWDDERQANLVRSLLMSLPIGSVIVSVLPWQATATDASWRVVDGKQRIEALRRFTSGSLAVPGAWFHGAHLNDEALRAKDVTWGDLSDTGKRKFLNLPVSCLEFDGETEMTRKADGTWDHRERTPAELLAAEAELFGLINGAGVDQTAEDMKRAARIAAPGSHPCACGHIKDDHVPTLLSRESPCSDCGCCDFSPASVDQSAEDMERAARIARGPVPTDHVGCAGPELCARPDCPNFAGR